MWCVLRLSSVNGTTTNNCLSPALEQLIQDCHNIVALDVSDLT